jgi:tetratricopeptide (TPR) repeat protein
MAVAPLLLSLLAAAAAAQPDTTGQGTAPPDSAADILGSALSPEEKIRALNDLIRLNPRNPDLYNNLGVIYAEQEEWVPARDAFIAAVQCDPRQPEAHRNLGMVMAEMGQVDMAVTEFQAYQKFSTDGGLDAWLMIGDARRDAGDVPAALAAYEEGLRAYGGAYGPGSAELVIARALLLEESGDTAAYEALLRRFAEPARDYLAAAGGSPVDQAGRASEAIVARLLQIIVDNAALMSEAGLHAQAAAAYQEAMDLAPDKQELLPLAAVALFEAGDVMEAKVLAKRATLENPAAPGGWKARGRIAEAEKRPHDAIEAYRRCWELDDTQTDVAARIGQIYLSLGDNVGARKFMGAVASDPDTPPEILYNYGLSLQRDGAHELALRPLRKVVEREPAMESAWRALAASLRSTERYGQAAEAYGRAFALGGDPRLAFQQGWCLQHDGRPLEAAEAYERALALDPDDTRARYNHGLSLMAAGEYADALASFQLLGLMEPDSYRVLFNTGVCHQNLGQHEEALLAYESALDVDETSAVWNNMGLVYDAMGDKEDAKQCYEEGKRLKSEGK